MIDSEQHCDALNEWNGRIHTYLIKALDIPSFGILDPRVLVQVTCKGVIREISIRRNV